ncbi:Zinc finger CCCH domain-containing protein 48 [Vitis vinifera]|uniref:Zinc finger CCCH domain-containing protein 48 n=1 Tax=Vitis vinifera TaxID=29760 RepID=A0A438GAE7_VITVI|nr:Zinc finger CCCH domain-containing protein 48 [Vitis vinifera]
MDIKPSRLIGDKNERERRHVNNMVCSYWLRGRCNRNPCRFLHQELPQNTHYQISNQFGKNCWQRNPDSDSKSASSLTSLDRSSGSTTPKCSSASNQSHRNNRERSLYSDQKGEWDSTNLSVHQVQQEQEVALEMELHRKAMGFSSWQSLMGTSWPSLELCFLLAQRSSILPVEMGIYGFGTAILVNVMVWSIWRGNWVLNQCRPLGICWNKRCVKAWNIESCANLSLDGPVGQIYAMVNGTIHAWKANKETNAFEPATTLEGHNGAVVSLTVGGGRLYSGSMDNTIRVWDLDTLQCIHTLKEHASVVMSLVCWGPYLISCSLDQTIKVWFATEAGNLEVTYTHNEEHVGCAISFGMNNLEGKPILLFTEKGRIFAKEEVREIQIGPGGLVFTGDGTGQVDVWKWQQSQLH